MIRFERGYLITFGDLERCPFTTFTKDEAEWKRAHEWLLKDDQRLLFIALERYLLVLDYLKRVR